MQEFISKLKEHDITVVCDVRAIATSRRLEFRKCALGIALFKNGIEYHHYPDLGITPKERRDAVRLNDHDGMLRRYKDRLGDDIYDLSRTLGWVAHHVRMGKNTAVMCCEADPMKCHRHIISNSLVKYFKVGMGVHL